MKDGVYFGVPMDEYRREERLGATDLINLNKSAGDFWARSWLGPDAEEEEDAEELEKWQIVGTAYHCARLEPEEFAVRYARKPCRADFAEQAQKFGACWNGTQIGDALQALAETKKAAGESVAAQAQRLAGKGYEGVIWPLIEAKFNDGLEGRIALDAKVWDEITRDMERLQRCKAIASKFTDAGASEVTVLWTDENNIPRKARFDRLEIEHWLDFKTFDNKMGKRLDQCIADAIRYNRYYVTAASYCEAAEALRDPALAIEGDPSEKNLYLVSRIRLRPAPLRCWFVFQQKRGIPNLVAREFIFHAVPDAIENSWDVGASDEAIARGHAATMRPTQIYQKGMAEIDYGKRLFAMYSQVYRPGEPWAPLDPERSVSDLDFPQFWLEGRYE